MKYFPDCYHYDEDELNRIFSVALQTKECQQVISKIKSESRENTPTQVTIPNDENESEGDAPKTGAYGGSYSPHRGKEQSAVEKASYISRSVLVSEYDGQTYRPKYHDVICCEL